jgi:DNA adenine methylase
MGRIGGVPHPFPYQGSKRQLAREILARVPAAGRLVEPFAGSAAVTLAAASLGRAERFWVNDGHPPLAGLWAAILNAPLALADGYAALWEAQRGNERQYYDEVRDRFNATHEPALFLYLLARCVKAAVRYNSKGEFNNSPDNRRLGMHPTTMRANIRRAADLLSGRCVVTASDYATVLEGVTPADIVYLDPPYQGVSSVRDHRYCGGIEYQPFADALSGLVKRGVPYLVSYDGRTGRKVHGRPLPESLGLTRLELEAGVSSQATLLGRTERTVESLYLSPALVSLLPARSGQGRTTPPNLFAHA